MSIEKTVKSTYRQIPVLLNEDNDDLFIGPNNLLQKDKIESVELYDRLIYDEKELEAIEQADHEIELVTTNAPDGTAEPISNHLVGFFQIGKLMTSHMNIVHGGAIATLIDEFFVKVALPLTPDNFAVTANLEVKYMRPLQFQEGQRLLDVLLEAFIVEMKEHRKFKVVGYLRCNGERCARGELMVVVPRKKATTK